jgi:uncharacterized protein YdaU (DUF1376 family)
MNDFNAMNDIFTEGAATPSPVTTSGRTPVPANTDFQQVIDEAVKKKMKKYSRRMEEYLCELEDDYEDRLEEEVRRTKKRYKKKAKKKSKKRKTENGRDDFRHKLLGVAIDKVAPKIIDKILK